jgi:hypothetical protein
MLTGNKQKFHVINSDKLISFKIVNLQPKQI